MIIRNYAFEFTYYLYIWRPKRLQPNCKRMVHGHHPRTNECRFCIIQWKRSSECLNIHSCMYLQSLHASPETIFVDTCLLVHHLEQQSGTWTMEPCKTKAECILLLCCSHRVWPHTNSPMLRLARPYKLFFWQPATKVILRVFNTCTDRQICLNTDSCSCVMSCADNKSLTWILLPYSLHLIKQVEMFLRTLIFNCWFSAIVGF